jgi:hypothetical protein
MFNFYAKRNHIVPDREDTDVFPEEWIEQYGRLALPSYWTQELWQSCDKAMKRFIYRSCVDFEFFHHNVYLPFKSENEGEEYPTVLPPFMSEYTHLLQKMCPIDMLPFERKPESTRKWKLCVV